MSWLKNVWRRRWQERELDAELQFHIERRIDDHVEAGLSREEARRRVQLEFGGLELTKDECRDVRPLRWLDDLIRDVPLGFRGLARDRLFAVAVTAILGIGIATSVTMFSVLNAVVLRPLPYARPGELATINTHLIAQNRWDGTSMANLIDWRAQSKTFVSMTFYRRTMIAQVTFAGIDAPQRAQEGLVGPEFFGLLGTPTLVGRTFSLEEFDRKERVVVLSEGLWREQFGGSDSVVGRKLAVAGEDHVIIGVMPRAFQLPSRETRLWRPLSVLGLWPGALSVRDGDQFEVLGRLAPRVRFEEAVAELQVIGARLRQAHAVNANIDIRIVPLVDHVIGERTRGGMWVGFAAVLSLLAIACANAGGLLSARAARRRRELAVRSALGAGRARLVRQLLAEGISLWAVASAVGLLLAYTLIQLLLAYGPRALPRIEDVSLDAAAVAVALLGGLVVVFACGTVPALAAAKADAGAAFTVRDSSGLPRHRLQDVLVVAQVAGALMLVVGAVLFAQSFLRAQRENPGFPAKNLVIVPLNLPGDRYPGRPGVMAFFREARERIGRLPGVVAVGGMTDFFIVRNADQWVTIEGRPAGRDAGAPRLAVEGVTPGYFRGAGIDLVEGREFEDRDYEDGAPAVYIVNETLAQRFWPGQSAIGKRLVGGETPPKDGRWATVVGVVRDIRRESLDVTPIMLGFIPAFPRTMDLTIRAAGNAESLIEPVRGELRAIAPTVPFTQVFTANGRFSERLDGRRFETQVLSMFGGIAMLLAGAGLYALLAYQVTLRTREIGIRSALGAPRGSIVTLFLSRGLRLAGLGAVIGIAGAVSVARLLQSLLYETPAINLGGYVTAAAFMLVVAGLAAYVPARRAASVNAIIALRDD
jgi:putative ABC transport system permease protein